MQNNIDFGSCPQCGAKLERRLGDRLVCPTPDCGYSAEMYGESSRSWLYALRQDESLWQKKYFEDYPTPISHEYRRLMLNAANGRVFCMVYQIKDVGEIMLKFPVLCAAALLKDFEITKLLVEKQPSLGDWERVCSQLVKKSGGEYAYSLPQPLRNILASIKDMYGQTLFVKKRNDYIGHGAMGFEDNEEYRTYCEQLLRAMARHLEDTHDDYAQLSLTIGEQELRGWHKAELMEGESSPALTVCGQTVELYPFIIRLENGVYFFDHLDASKRTKPSYGLNYVKGGNKRRFDAPYFAEVYERAGCKFDPSHRVEDAVSDVEAEKALAALSEAAGFVRPEAILNWVRDNVVDECRGGVHLLTMERGMGKTALAYALADGTVRLSGVKVCAYYCSQSQLRGPDSFTNGVMNSIIGTLVETKTGEFRRLDLKAEDRKQNMIAVLSYFNDIYSRRGEGEKLLLILDGLDEIPANCANVFDFIPSSADMPENVYILLTARNPKRETLAPHVVSSLSRLKVGKQYIVKPESAENIDTLKKYLASAQIVRTAAGRRAPDDVETERLLSISGCTFLNLRVYAKLVEAGYPVLELPELTSEQLFMRYLEEIHTVYGDKLYDEALKALLIIATAQEPLTLQELAYLCGYDGVNLALLAFVKDFGALVKAERGSGRGTQLVIAGERYTIFVNESFKDVLKSIYEYSLDMLKHEECDEYGVVADGPLYLAAHIRDIALSLSNDLPKDFAEILVYIARHTRVLYCDDVYRLERIIDCSNAVLGLVSEDEEDYRYGYCVIAAYELRGSARYRIYHKEKNELEKKLEELSKLTQINKGTNNVLINKNASDIEELLEEAINDIESAHRMRKKMYIHGAMRDEEIRESCLSLAKLLADREDHSRALVYYDEAIEMLERLFAEGKLHDENDIADVRMNRANTYQKLARYDEALADYDRAIEIMERLFAAGKLHDENDIAMARMNRAITYHSLTRYDEALADYDRAIEISERLFAAGKLHDENDIATARMNRAITYHSLTRYDEALADYDRAIEIRRRLEAGRHIDESALAQSYIERATTMSMVTRYDEALMSIDKAIEIMERLFAAGKLHDENYIATARINRANTYNRLTRYDEALAEYDRAIEIMERLFAEGKLHDENDIAMARMNRAVTYTFGTEEYDMALVDMDKVIKIRTRLVVAEGRTYLAPKLEQAKELRGLILQKKGTPSTQTDSACSRKPKKPSFFARMRQRRADKKRKKK